MTSVFFDIANDTGWSALHLYLTFSDIEYILCVSVFIETLLQMKLFENHEDQDNFHLINKIVRRDCPFPSFAWLGGTGDGAHALQENISVYIQLESRSCSVELIAAMCTILQPMTLTSHS